MGRQYVRHWTFSIIAFPILASSVEIGFQTQSQISQSYWRLQEAWPEGRSCYSVKADPRDPITSIKLRTSRTDINRKKTPDAIGFFHGKRCVLETLQFVVFYYLPSEDAVDQKFNLDELPALFRSFNKYREIKEGTLEWLHLLSKAIKDGNSLNEGDAVYQLADGTWYTLPSVVEVTDVPNPNNPFPKTHDWYLNQGLRKSTLNRGNYLGHFRNQPATDYMRSKTANIERDEAQRLLQLKSRKEWPQNDFRYSAENFKIMPSPLEMLSRSRISEVGSPLFPGPSKKSLSPLLKTATADEGNVDPEDAIEWDEQEPEARVLIPQMLSMDLRKPQFPRKQANPRVETGQSESGEEYIIPEDIYYGITHPQLSDERYYPITTGKTSRTTPGRRNIYSSDYFGIPEQLGMSMSDEKIDTFIQDELNRTPENLDKTGMFSPVATDYIEEESKVDNESWGRIDAFAKYTGPTQIRKKIPKPV
ncbi:hypothetical protein TWF281_011638 [Arthrobotrys megalospora]